MKLPMFENQKQYEKFFERDRKICEKYRDANGTITVSDKKEFESFLHELLGDDITFDVKGSAEHETCD